MRPLRLVRPLTPKNRLRRVVAQITRSVPSDHIEWQRLLLRIAVAKKELSA